MNNPVVEEVLFSKLVDFLFNLCLKRGNPPVISAMQTETFLEKNKDYIKKYLIKSGVSLSSFEEFLHKEIGNKLKFETFGIISKFLNVVDLSFINKIHDAGTLQEEFCRERISELITEIIYRRDLRLYLDEIVNSFLYNIADRYLEKIENQKGFIYEELLKFFTELASFNYISSYIKISILLRSICCRFDGNSIDNIKIQGIPDALIKTAIYSLKGNGEDPASSIVAILCLLARSYKKTDHGNLSLSQEASWFYVALRNNFFSTYQRRIIKDLYDLSMNNCW
ncbi:MAG TPA: hypothetical protein PLA51_11545 [Spirochaetota bacterium]|jgi:hypothetical protein|nr:hypothetical protein [Spirochaetota bacterium]HON17100.1 hypothetical protein [Spirochaetota bacterium]HOV08400.1 hypothetical protein [Spirochaetota bacterium]HRS62115.1 hypothetical protein [Spirochaetota bacterium]HRU65723.1 hypothetical protein [Spirochaetota bacterium]